MIKSNNQKQKTKNTTLLNYKFHSSEHNLTLSEIHIYLT